jgi:ribonucleoside-diphosphate reductase alpha chain
MPSCNPSRKFTRKFSEFSALTTNANRILEARYLKRDSQGQIIETPAELFNRVALAVAEGEQGYGNSQQAPHWHEQFQNLMTSLDFLPNSPALMNAGLPLGQLSACFVIPVEDSIEGIFEALKKSALVQQTGGGTGFSFSSLRPKGDLVKSTGGQASGPISFMKIFDVATEHIKQGGKRRGANMGVLRVDHPDIFEFINAKKDQEALKNFNISVAVTDTFLEAVRHQDFYDLIHPQTKKRINRIPAKPVFDAIVEAAWETGDPGLLFLDALNRANPTPSLGSFEATNPCGEIPLLPNEACNLGSINLAHHISTHGDHTTIDWAKLETTVYLAMRFLDNLIDVNHYPSPEFETISRNNRKIGLGVMGFAELLIRLGIPYDSEAAIATGEDLMREINQIARKASQELAKERGVFPNWEQSVFHQQHLRMRNATCTAIAPTGTISLIAGTTHGIEPLYALFYQRSHTLGGPPLIEKAPLLDEFWPKEVGAASGFSVKGDQTDRFLHPDMIPKEIRQLFVTSFEISPEMHLRVQAAFQRHVDNAVSKTINLPHEAKLMDIESAYWRAWELGLKGITIFRDRSKGHQILEANSMIHSIASSQGVCHPC